MKQPPTLLLESSVKRGSIRKLYWGSESIRNGSAEDKLHDWASQMLYSKSKHRIWVGQIFWAHQTCVIFWKCTLGGGPAPSSQTEEPLLIPLASEARHKNDLSKAPMDMNKLRNSTNSVITNLKKGKSPPKVCTPKVCAPKVCAPKVCAPKVYPPKVCVQNLRAKSLRAKTC